MQVVTQEHLNSSRFELRARLGQGGGGVVYAAWDRVRRTEVAVKMLRQPGPELLLLLKQEFRGAEDLVHPNLVRLGELFEESGQWFFTMELVRGTDLLSYVQRPHPSGEATSAPLGFDEARLRGAFGQLATGLRALHATSRVHRDVKPSNILVTPEGRVVLLDFGVLSDQRRPVARDKGAEGLVGTVAYMAPEQALGEPAGPPADWYAFGVVLYQCLTGKLPFSGSAGEVIEAKVNGRVVHPDALGVEAPRELVTLCMNLLEPSPSDRATWNDVASVLVKHEDPVTTRVLPRVFVGRRAELASLSRSLGAVRGGGGGAAVVVRGESGVGKSALVSEWVERERSAEPSLLVLSGRCFERESVPYKAVDDVIDNLCAFLRDLPDATLADLVPPHAGLLCEAFPVLAQVEPFLQSRSVGDGELVPREKRARMFAALRELLHRVARLRPTVVVIDDIQWADEDSLALLHAILSGACPAVLFVLTERVATQKVPPRHDAFLPKGTQFMDVACLPPDDAGALALSLAGAAANDAGFAMDVARETQGHPMFIDALVRTRQPGRSGAVVRLDDAVYARVERLPPLARRVVELLAVAGLPVPQDVCASAASLDIGDLFDLFTLLRGENLVRTEGTAPTDAVSLYHDRVRESVGARLPSTVKAEWHGKLALAFESLGVGDPEALTLHWEGAGNLERALGYAVKASDEAARAFAFERAARLYRWALDLADKAPNDRAPNHGALRAELLEKRAVALSNGGLLAEAASVLLMAVDGADAQAAIDLRRRAAEWLLCSGRYVEGLDLMRAVVRAVGLVYPEGQLGTLLRLMLVKILCKLRLKAYKRRPPRAATALARLRADCAWSAGNGLGMTDTLRGIYFKGLHVLEVEPIADAPQLARALAWEAMGGGGADHAYSQRLLSMTRSLAEEDKGPSTLAWTRACDGGLAYFWGEWHRAIEPLAEAETLFRDRCQGVSFEINSLRLMIYRTLAFRGLFRELALRVTADHAQASQQNDLYALNLVTTTAAAPVALAADDTDAVEADLARAGKELPTTGFLVQHYLHLTALGQLDLYRGRGAEAHGRLVGHAKALKRSHLPRIAIIRIQVREQRARAALLAAAGATDGAAFLRDAAAQIKGLEREPDAWARALAQVLGGALALARGAQGDRDAAARELVRGADACDASGLHVYAASARLRASALVAGAEGAALRARAEGWFERQGVKSAERMAALHVPGA